MPTHPGRGRGADMRLQMQQSFPDIRVPCPQNSTQVISIITNPRPVLNPTSLQNLMSAQVTQKSVADTTPQSGYVYELAFCQCEEYCFKKTHVKFQEQSRVQATLRVLISDDDLWL